MTGIKRLSVVVPVTQDEGDLAQDFIAYKTVLADNAEFVDFIYVLDGQCPQAVEALKSLKIAGEPLQILSFAKSKGEAAALSVGCHHAEGDVIMTLPAKMQVKTEELARLLVAFEGTDMVVAQRRLDREASFGREKKLEYILKLLLNSPFKDLRCGVRILRPRIAEEIPLYNNQHRFWPILAQEQGFVVRELEVEGYLQRKLSPGVDINIVLDVMTVYFLLRFLRKPFRFFGGVGFTILAIGVIATGYLVIERLFFGIGLADRPALILSTLMIVLGIQILAVGLIGEIITFSYTKDIKPYKVERIVK
ncbi:MAG: glycosyltransferase [Cyanobacteria bacterium J06638_22]